MRTPLQVRLTPSFVVAVLALLVAVGGTGFAAGQITSAQIKNGTITGKDVKDRSLSGKDVKDRSLTGADVKDGSLSGADVTPGSLPRTALDRRCPTGYEAAFGGCVSRISLGKRSFQSATADCSLRGGRLPSVGELRWIATHDEFTWADGDPGNYEFSGQYTGTYPVTPMALDSSGNVVSNASAYLFHYRCVVS